MRSSIEYNEHILLSKLESRIYYEWCRKNGISYSLLQVLDVLYQQPEGIDAKYICDTMFIYKQTLTGLIKQLESSKYIQIKKDSIDKRRKLIILTKTGFDYVEGILTRLYEKEDITFNCLSDQEKKIFNRLYRKVVQTLQKELG
ncbi:MarR family winged helix-turn-helix transcriptional regulator [Clostridium brassicae]|uniref:MarR family transcriptional regulator n=1 Tax=Clostridium brassicae TaxID=2999072 RepID=A0ABT4D898_9CLOT|nr:MarR family transcriptional regulator [Clostridium brassicae]MCY6957436.1 MarR family transcriptional regulator [Clostridium brassicae]